MVKAALRTVAGLIVAVLLSALMVMAAPIASAQEPAPAPIPAAPEGFTLVDEEQRTANDLPEGALLLGDGVRPPAGYTSVQRQVAGTCRSIPLGNGASTQVCKSFSYAIPENGPTGAPVPETGGAAPGTPALPAVGTGDPGSGTYGFDETCEDMTKDTGSWLSPSQAALKIFANVTEQGCKVANVITHPGDALAKMWDSQFGKTVKSMIAGVADGFGTLLNWWFSIPTPKLANADYLTVLQAYMLPIQAGVLLASIMIAVIRVVLAHSGGEGAASQELTKIIVRTIFASALFGVAITAGTTIADSVSLWLLNESSGGDLGEKVKAMLLDDNSTWGPGWILLISILGMAGTLFQALLLVIRQAFLIVIVGFLPMAASGSGTGMGSSAYQKMINWTVAFILFKPVAAGIMATAFWAADPGSDASKLQGLMLLSVAAVALPAVMRVLGVSSSNSGSGLGAAGPMLAGAGMAAAVASGGTSMAVKAGMSGGKAALGGLSGGGGSQGGYSGQAAGSGARQMSAASVGNTSSRGGSGNGGGGSRPPSKPSTPAGGGTRPAGRGSTAKAAASNARAGLTSAAQGANHAAADISNDIPQRSMGSNEVPQ